MKYRRKTKEVEAVQWFKLGDHPNVKLNSNGDFVLDNPYEEQIIKPGDWIVPSSSEFNYCFSLSDAAFKMTYEKVPEQNTVQSIIDGNKTFPE